MLCRGCYRRSVVSGGCYRGTAAALSCQCKKKRSSSSLFFFVSVSKVSSKWLDVRLTYLLTYCSTCRTPTSSSTRPARDGWPAARKRAKARTDAARAARRARSAGPVRTELLRLIESRIVFRTRLENCTRHPFRIRTDL